MKKLAILSVSGGMDSAAVSLKALEAGYDIFVLNFDYGQKNVVEMKAYKNVINELLVVKNKKGFKGNIIGEKTIDLKPMFDEFLSIWQDMRDNGKNEAEAYHQFYMPSRNLLFSVIAAVVGEIIALVKDYEDIKIGLGIHKHSEDAYGKNHRDYWDITPEFGKRLNDLFALNDVKNVSLFAPFVNKVKSEVLKYLIENEFDYKKTWTCYNPRIGNKYEPCKVCEACKERELAGIANGITDVNNYSIEKEN